MSSGSESDDDYVPGEPEQLSEEGSADEETDLQFERELNDKAQKRKITKPIKGKKKRKVENTLKEDVPAEKSVEENTEAVVNEEEKKKEDDLWAKFLEGTSTQPSETKPKPATKESKSVTEVLKLAVNKEDPPKAEVTSSDDKARERRIFEFAGETIVVEDNIIKEKIKTADSPAAIDNNPVGPTPRGRPGGGISSVLGQLNKKNKLSTLEKSKLDWTMYKKEEGIEEEIQSHNKGKDGFLDKRDFLERADVRQYEIERDLRLKRRSNR